MAEQSKDPSSRAAQRRLAEAVTALVHGEEAAELARVTTDVLTGHTAIDQISGETLENIRQELPAVKSDEDGSITEALVAAGLASSNTEARRLISGNAVSINGVKASRENFAAGDFQNGRLLLRRGKAFKDSALVEST